MGRRTKEYNNDVPRPIWISTYISQGEERRKQGDRVEGERAQARPRPSLARRSRGRVSVEPTRTIAAIGFSRTERVFDDEKLISKARSCALVLLVVSSTLGSMKEVGLL